MIGIYKITSPNNKIYIGQSTDIFERWKKYKRLNCVKQVLLYRSLKKYDPINHKFEIIEECLEDKLLERETYWKNFYKVLEIPSLCCRIDGRGGRNSEETNRKIGLKNKGKLISKETRDKISKALKGRKITWVNKGNKGYKYTKEDKLKLSNSLKEYYKNNAPPIHFKIVSPKKVDKIRLKYKKGMSKSALSREYKVSWGTIKNIVDKINSYS